MILTSSGTTPIVISKKKSTSILPTPTGSMIHLEASRSFYQKTIKSKMLAHWLPIEAYLHTIDNKVKMLKTTRTCLTSLRNSARDLLVKKCLDRKAKNRSRDFLTWIKNKRHTVVTATNIGFSILAVTKMIAHRWSHSISLQKVPSQVMSKMQILSFEIQFLLSSSTRSIISPSLKTKMAGQMQNRNLTSQIAKKFLKWAYKQKRSTLVTQKWSTSRLNYQKMGVPWFTISCQVTRLASTR